MGKTFENLTWDDLCDLMCGGPEPEPEEDNEIKEGENKDGKTDEKIAAE